MQFDAFSLVPYARHRTRSPSPSPFTATTPVYLSYSVRLQETARSRSLAPLACSLLFDAKDHPCLLRSGVQETVTSSLSSSLSQPKTRQLLPYSRNRRSIPVRKKKAELAISDLLGNGAGITAAASTVISTFFLVFVAEWGDKSFFSTIALAAASSPLGVIGGALAGHAFATLLAVLGGSLLGTYVSEKVIAYIGGTLFLVFAGVTFIEILS